MTHESAPFIPDWLTHHWQAADIHTLPKNLAEFRQKHWNLFIAQGLPQDFSFLNEKHFSQAKHPDIDHITDIINQHRLQKEDSILLVSINGRFLQELSDIQKLPEEVLICSMAEAWDKHEDKIVDLFNSMQSPLVHLNAAMSQDGLFLFLPDHCGLTLPIHHISLIYQASEGMAHTRNLIHLGKNSKLSYIEEYASLADYAYLSNTVTMITLSEHAEIKHCKIQEEGKQAIHLAHIFLSQKENSQAYLTAIGHGAHYARENLIVKLQEKMAACYASGFYHAQADGQAMEYHLDIEHAAPSTQSEMLYKGILNNKSRAVFNGRAQVGQQAQKTVAYQGNHNLLLSKQAEVYTKPVLEIYADDVKCKHGATVGQLDPAALFYLRSRGIEQAMATHILLQGFAEEIFQRITHPGVWMRVQTMV